MAKAKLSVNLSHVWAASGSDHGLQCDYRQALADKAGMSLGEYRAHMLRIAKREAFKARARDLERKGLKNPGVNKPKAVEPEVIERVEERAPVERKSKFSVIDRAKAHGARTTPQRKWSGGLL